jgi:hypothetical protein
MSVLGAFNNVLINFIDDCILVFPEDRDFKVYKASIKILVKINPKKVLTIFANNTQIYKSQILEKNEDFFLKNDYSEVINNTKKTDISDDEINEIIKKIQGYWIELEKTNKEKIWDYMLLLVNLSDKYYESA